MNMPYTLPLEEQAYLSTLLTQPHRHYHNIIHVNDCLAEAYKMFNEKVADEHKHLTYAIWYHDAIYNPYAPQGVNEHESAELFIRYHTNKHDVHLNTVAYAIRATAKHTVTQSITTMVGDEEEYATFARFMLDIDLSGLGKSSAVFALNSLNIRREYHATSDMDVVKGRLKFFTQLNKRESFYYTDYFKDLYHVQSKKNVEHELSMLQHAIDQTDPQIYFDDLKAYTRGYP